MSYIKLVNGEPVTMTALEIEERQAEEVFYAARKQKYEVEQKYADQRKEKLAPIDGEGMDAMRKAIEALAAGRPVPQEFDEYITKVEAIKQQYPKPVK